ncbi:hypothetical protein ACO0R3_002440 [Hanseniaspora guilliermondii]
MSDLKKLFRATKLKELRLAPANTMEDPIINRSKYSIALTQGKKHPIHQEVETYEHLKTKYEDFGIKAKLPTSEGVNTNIIVGDIVTRFKATHYERDSQSSLNKQKFNFYNFPVKELNSEGIKKSSLFEEVGTVSYNLAEINEKFPYIIEALKTPEYKKKFRQYCLKHYPEKMKFKNFSANNFKLELEAFINKTMISEIDQIPENVRGFGGLTYSLNGRLSTDPNGVKHKHVIPSRMILNNNYMSLGFVSENVITGYNPKLRYGSKNVLKLTPTIFESFESSGNLDTARFKASDASLYKPVKQNIAKAKAEKEQKTEEVPKEEETVKETETVKSRILDAIKK